MASAPDLAFVVKICGITNQEDATAAVEAGADALGFNFYPKSPRYITPQRAREIIAAVPGAYFRVGVFVNPTEKELFEITEQLSLDVLQLHGNNCCPVSLSRPYRIWRSVAPGSEPAPNQHDAEAYLLDTPTPDFGGSGRTFDWRLATNGRNLAERHSYRIVLAGGLHASNVAEAIEMIKPWGVDACSCLESSPGKKDPQKVRDFIHAARQATEQLTARNI